MIDLAIPGSPAISGLVFRMFRGPQDYPDMLEVYRLAHAADGLDDVTSMEDLERNYATLVNCDPTRDLVIAEVDGRVVAYSRVYWQDLVDGARSYELFGFVDPAWRRRGIGGAMLRHNEQRLREIAAGHPDVAVKWLGSEGADTNIGNTALLEREGYERARFWYDMVAPTLEPIEPAPMPEGLGIRPVTRAQYDALWDAMAEAFRDHWGMSEWAEEDRVRFMTHPENADPALWRVGWDGGEIAGVIVTTVPVEENEAHGRARVYVASVSVRRPWRRRGLARALLTSSLAAARDAGYTSASLGVDTDSPTGATDLYRSLGFEPERTFTTWRKPL